MANSGSWDSNGVVQVFREDRCPEDCLPNFTWQPSFSEMFNSSANGSWMSDPEPWSAIIPTIAAVYSLVFVVGLVGNCLVMFVIIRDRVRSSVIREELGVEPLLLCVERSQLRWFGHLVRMPPGRLLERCSRHVHLGEDLGKTQAWERLGIPQSELATVAREREVWGPLLELLPPRPDPDKRLKMR
ncbi:hypothetical protein DPEC_G00373370 [Dallia pectoralis]|nr:hypothetical protein DPEC_G00373370 [Dallia pectoralis]